MDATPDTPGPDDSHAGADSGVAPDASGQPAEPDAGEWLPVPEALRRLGIAERTLYRRLSRGYTQKRTGLGGRLEVWVAQTPATGATPDTSGHQQEEQAGRALALVERFNLAVNQQVAPLLAMLNDRDATIRDQAEELGRLRQQVQDLEARRMRQDVTGDASGHPPHPSESPPRPWWAFWRRGVQGQP
jgi:hypothetical protein